MNHLGLVTIIITVCILNRCKDSVELPPDFSFSLPEVKIPIASIQDSIASWESKEPTREDNEARVVFHDDEVKKTEYSIVYLHGFAGSYMDGYPVNKDIADTLNANILFARWGDHGQYPPHALEHFTPEKAWNDAKMALVIGNILGEKVILMSTSTGGTLATMLAAKYPEKVFAVINISPNYGDDQVGSQLLNTFQGKELAHAVSLGKNKKISYDEPEAPQYWDTIYPAVALTHLENLVRHTMTEELFGNIRIPILILFYKKNAFQEDEHVEVDKYPKIINQIGTPENLKKLKSLDRPQTHFMGSEIKTDDFSLTTKEIVLFLREQLEIDI